MNMDEEVHIETQEIHKDQILKEMEQVENAEGKNDGNDAPGGDPSSSSFSFPSVSMWGKSLSSFVDVVKDKSAKALPTLGSDFNEFVSTVKTDVKLVSKNIFKGIEQVSSTLKNETSSAITIHDENINEKTESFAETKEEAKDDKPPKSFSDSMFAWGSKLESLGAKFLQGAEEMISGSPGVNNGHKINTMDDPNEPKDDESEASGKLYRLTLLQEETSTYVDVPKDVTLFTRWQNSLTFTEKECLKDNIILLYPIVQRKYEELVPGSVDDEIFWNNYLFKTSILAAQESRRGKLIEKSLDPNEEEELNWGTDDIDYDEIKKPVEDNASTILNTDEDKSKILDKGSEKNAIELNYTKIPVNEADSNDMYEDIKEAGEQHIETDAKVNDQLSSIYVTEDFKKQESNGDEWGEWD